MSSDISTKIDQAVKLYQALDNLGTPSKTKSLDAAQKIINEVNELCAETVGKIEGKVSLKHEGKEKIIAFLRGVEDTDLRENALRKVANVSEKVTQAVALYKALHDASSTSRLHTKDPRTALNVYKKIRENLLERDFTDEDEAKLKNEKKEQLRIDGKKEIVSFLNETVKKFNDIMNLEDRKHVFYAYQMLQEEAPLMIQTKTHLYEQVAEGNSESEKYTDLSAKELQKIHKEMGTSSFITLANTESRSVDSSMVIIDQKEVSMLLDAIGDGDYITTSIGGSSLIRTYNPDQRDKVSELVAVFKDVAEMIVQTIDENGGVKEAISMKSDSGQTKLDLEFFLNVAVASNQQIQVRFDREKEKQVTYSKQQLLEFQDVKDDVLFIPVSKFNRKEIEEQLNFAQMIELQDPLLKAQMQMQVDRSKKDYLAQIGQEYWGKDLEYAKKIPLGLGALIGAVAKAVSWANNPDLAKRVQQKIDHAKEIGKGTKALKAGKYGAKILDFCIEVVNRMGRQTLTWIIPIIPIYGLAKLMIFSTVVTNPAIKAQMVQKFKSGPQMLLNLGAGMASTATIGASIAAAAGITSAVTAALLFPIALPIGGALFILGAILAGVKSKTARERARIGSMALFQKDFDKVLVSIVAGALIPLIGSRLHSEQVSTNVEVKPPPLGADNTISLDEGSSHTLSTDDFKMDSDSQVSGFDEVRIEIADGDNGTFIVNGQVQTDSFTITADQLNNGDVIYNSATAGQDSIQFTLMYKGAGDPVANTVTFDIEPTVVAAHQPPVVAAETPVVQQEPPVVQQEPPVVQQEPPVVQQEPPVVQQEPPVVQQEPPPVNLTPPTGFSPPSTDFVNIAGDASPSFKDFYDAHNGNVWIKSMGGQNYQIWANNGDLISIHIG